MSDEETVPLSELEALVEKKVVATLAVGDDDSEEVTGTLEAVSEFMVVISTKKKVYTPKPDQILAIAEDAPKAKMPLQRTLKLMEHGNVAQHLADRHGFPKNYFGEAVKGNYDLLAVHEQYHAENPEVMHVHSDDEKPSPTKAAVEEAEQEQEADDE